MDILLMINKENLIHSLNLAWKGMLAIFLVMALIYLAIVALNFFTNKEKVKKLLEKIKGLKRNKKGEDISENDTEK